MTKADVRLHIEDRGQGRPVILMHGFGGSARNFRPQTRELKDSYRIVCFDARGHARSDAPDDPDAYLPEAFVGDVQHVIDEVGGKSVVLGGLSMGAAIALRYALKHPAQLAGLVVAAFPPAARDGNEKSWAQRFADAIETHGLERAGADFVWGGDRFDPQAQNFIRQGFLEHSPGALIHILRRVLDRQPPVESMERELRELSIPTLVVVGSNDASSLAPSKALAERIPHCHFEVIEGAGHVVNLAAPSEFNRVLRQFLDSLVSRFH